MLTLEESVSLGDALAMLIAEDIDVLSCREVQSEIEEAFVQLTGIR